VTVKVCVGVVASAQSMLIEKSIWSLLPFPHPPAPESQLMMVSELVETGSLSTAVFQGSEAWKSPPTALKPAQVGPEPDVVEALLEAPLLSLLWPMMLLLDGLVFVEPCVVPAWVDDPVLAFDPLRVLEAPVPPSPLVAPDD